MNIKSRNSAYLLIVGLAIVNYLLAGNFLGSIGFNLGRAALCLWGGWYLVAKTKSKRWHAALVGLVVLTIDHVILKGGYFLAAQAFSPESVENKGLLAFGGVIISFVMFAPVAALISFCGGLLGRYTEKAR